MVLLKMPIHTYCVSVYTMCIMYKNIFGLQGQEVGWKRGNKGGCNALICVRALMKVGGGLLPWSMTGYGLVRSIQAELQWSKL